MLLVICGWKDTKAYVFEIWLLVNVGHARLKHMGSKECYTMEETIEFTEQLNTKNKITYYNLTLDYNNNKKYKNVKKKN